MRFEAQAIMVRDRYFVFHSLPAMVGIQEDGTPTGLAYHLGIRSMAHNPIQYEGWYSLTHLASGLCVSWDPSVTDEATARRWLELIAPLTDWARPVWVLKEHASRLQQQVEAACWQACEEWQQQGEEVSKRTRPGVVVQEK